MPNFLTGTSLEDKGVNNRGTARVTQQTGRTFFVIRVCKFLSLWNLRFRNRFVPESGSSQIMEIGGFHIECHPRAKSILIKSTLE